MTHLPALLLPRVIFCWAGIVAAVVNAALRVAVVPVILQPLIDEVLVRQNMEVLPRVLITGCAVVVAGALALWLQDAFLGLVSADVGAQWRKALHRTLLKTPQHPERSSGALATRIVTDLKEVELYVQYGLGSLVAESLTLGFIVGLLMWQSIGITLLMLALSVPLIGVLWWVGRVLERTTRRTQESVESIGALLQEGLRQREHARVLNAHNFLIARLGFANERTERLQAQRAMLAALQTPVAQLLSFAVIALLLILLARAYTQGNITLGQLSGYITLLALTSTPLQLLPRAYALLQQARAAQTRLHELWQWAEVTQEEEPEEENQTPRAPKPTADSTTPKEQKGLYPAALTVTLDPPKPLPDFLLVEKEPTWWLTCEEIRFAYPDTPTHVVLDRLSLRCARPNLIAITGESGIGKSTLLRVLLGLEHPQQGRVTLLGDEVLALPEQERYHRITLVPQEPFMLRASVRANLTLGQTHSSDALWQALEAVQLNDKVTELPEQLDTVIREDGQGLSSGQKQRLNIARALLRDPQVLLLDEPSANLDVANETLLIEALRKQARERLVIVVTHNPTLAKVADARYTLQNGRLQRGASRAG